MTGGPCANLVRSLETIPGVVIRCVDSGRGRGPLMVFFDIKDHRWLYVIGRACDRNYGGYGFRCELSTTDLPERPVGFVLWTDTALNDLRGPPLKGREAYRAANALALRILDILYNSSVLEHFGLLL